MSLTFEPGLTTAVVGSTGSGKTTLLNLVPRLYDVTGGAVLLDGVDVRDLARQDLWACLGLVPQRTFLFSGTVAENLRYGKEDATDDELWHALDVAQAREVVEQIPGGLEGRIEQGGANLSGGQRQRLAIARALVRRPPSTSSTTASPPSTTRPTPGCARRSAPTPTPRRWSSWRNGSAAC